MKKPFASAQTVRWRDVAAGERCGANLMLTGRVFVRGQLPVAGWLRVRFDARRYGTGVNTYARTAPDA